MATSAAPGFVPTYEDVVLMLPQRERQVVVDMRSQLLASRTRVEELEKTVRSLTEKQTELEEELRAEKGRADIATATVTAVTVASRANQQAQATTNGQQPGPTDGSGPMLIQPTVTRGPGGVTPHAALHDLFSAMKMQHQATVDAIRKRTAEAVSTLDDSGFDAFVALHNSVARSLRPLPKNFEHVDLTQMKDTLQAEGHIPQSVQQVAALRDFVGYIDTVRQITKDNQYCFMHNDTVRMNLLRKAFDAAKLVEARVGPTTHLQLPPAALGTMDIIAKDFIDTTQRQKEFNAHVAALNQCGEVFIRARREVETIEDTIASIQNIPNFAPEFDTIAQQMALDMDALQRNDQVLTEGGLMHTENLLAQRQTLIDDLGVKTEKLRERYGSVEKIYDEMTRLVLAAEDEYREMLLIENAYSKSQQEVARCDHRVNEMRRAVEVETQKLRKYSEGAKFATFLSHQAKDLFKRMLVTADESIRSRKEFCERTMIAAQEQLYSMAEVLHDLLVKRNTGDNNRMRADHAALETANRALVGLVHSPADMDRQMNLIRELTVNISNAKQRIAATNNDINMLRQVLSKYGTMQFLKRDANFLMQYDGAERVQRVRERVEDSVQHVKYVAEILVEVNDPDTRQDYILQQCLEGLKVCISELTDIVAQRDLVAELDEGFTRGVMSRLRRHQSLITHFAAQMRDGESDVPQVEPAIEGNTLNLLGLLDVLMSALAGDDSGGAPLPRGQSTMHGSRAASLLPHGRQGTYGGGANGNGASGAASAAPSMRRDHHGYGHGDPHVGLDAVASGAGGGSGAPGGMGGQGAHRAPVYEEIVNEIYDEHHTIARLSAKLKLAQDQRKVLKPAAGIELSNTSAIGSVGFRANTGVHSFCVRIGKNCTRLLVGVADWNLPLDGYCNSLKYPGCYYLHVGSGTLWAPELRYERKSYTHHAIGAAVGSVLRVIVDTGACTVGFVWDDVNLGVAFRGVNMTRTLYPAFEVFSNECAFELIEDPRLAARR